MTEPGSARKCKLEYLELKGITLVPQPPLQYKAPLEAYQSLIVGAAATVIGVASLLNAVWANYLNNKNRHEDKSSKILAFICITQEDLKQNLGTLEKMSEILSWASDLNPGSQAWIGAIRLASRNILRSPFDGDWEKISVLDTADIRKLRKISVQFSDVSNLFAAILDDPNPVRSQGALPLWENKPSEEEAEGEEDRLQVLFQEVIDAVNEAKAESQNIIDSFSTRLEI